jgi:hypothetical protein
MTLGKPSSSYKALAGLIIAVLLVGGGFLLLKNTNKKPSSPVATKASKLVIKDLGVQITLPKALVGTTTDTSTPPKSAEFTPLPIVNFKLNQYSALAQKCLDSKYNFNTPYASFSKISGKAAAGDKQLMKQFNGFYIDQVSDGLKITCKDQITQAALDDLNNIYAKALKDAFTKAQLIN